MGHSLKSVPFWSAEIVMSEIITCTNKSDFFKEGLPISALGQKRIGFSSLQQFDDNERHYLLTLKGGDMIEFVEN